VTVSALSETASPPGRLPLLGDYLSYRADRLGFWTDVGRNGPLVEVRFGTQRFAVVTDPAIAEHILLTAVKDHPRDRRLMALNRGPGPELMFNTDRWDEWKHRRRILSPGFHRSHIAGFASAIVAGARVTAARLAGEDRADVQAVLRDMTMRIILATMFSVTDEGETRRLQEVFETSSRVVASRASAPVPLPYWVPTPTNFKLRRQLRYKWRTLSRIIRQRVEDGPGRQDLLDLLLARGAGEEGSDLSLRDLVGEMSGIVFAGHETTAETLTWLIYEVSRHPPVEQRLLEEFADVLAGRDPTMDDLAAMPYTERVILETLRLHPPVYLTIREADVDQQLDGFHIPRGTRLVLNIRGLHRDPAAWTDPDRFDPDRFAPERSSDRHRFQYLPFLDGPKKCLGDTFAMTEMRLVVPVLLGALRFVYEAPEPPEPFAGFTLAVRNGLPMKVRSRMASEPEGR
jgi:cytochrome P450